MFPVPCYDCFDHAKRQHYTTYHLHVYMSGLIVGYREYPRIVFY